MCAVLALGLAFTLGQLVVTLFHEAGHAVGSIVFGAGFSGIGLHASGDGITHFALTSRLGAVPVYAGGYLAPGLAGWLISWAYASGHTTLVLAVLASISAVVAVVAMNLFGFALSAGLAGLAGWAFLSGGTLTQSLIVLVLAWLLLLGGTGDAARTIVFVDDDEDHDVLESLTWVPAQLWGILFTAVNAWCLYAGGRLLFGGA